MPRSLEGLRCLTCNVELSGEAPRRGPMPRYCSSACKRPGKLSAGAMTPCQRCGTPFPMNAAGRARMYCGSACTSKAQGERISKARECPDCGKRCHAKADCCRSCSSKRKNAAEAAALAGTVRECGWCGKEFTPIKGNQDYCKRSCNNRNHCFNRMSWRRGAEKGEAIALIDVYKRDGGKCCVCGVAVDLNIRWPDPQSASLDHAVPISKGGPHTFSNVQLTHLGCNASKGDE